MQVNIPPPSQIPIPQPGQISVPQPGQIPHPNAQIHPGYTQAMYHRHMYPSVMPLSVHSQTMQPTLMYPTVMHGMTVYPENIHGVMPTHSGAMFSQAMHPQGMYPQATHYRSTQPMQFQAKQTRQTILSPEELAQSRSSVTTGAGSYLLSLPLNLTMIQLRDALWKFIPSSRADKEFIFFEVLNGYLPFRGQDPATVSAFCRYKPHQRYSPVDPAMVERKRREKAEKVEKAGKLGSAETTSNNPQGAALNDVQKTTSNESQETSSNNVSQVQLNPAATTFVLPSNPSTVPTTPIDSQDRISDSDTATSHSPSMKVTAIGIEGLAEVVETLERAQLAATEDMEFRMAASMPLPESRNTTSEKSEVRAASAPPTYRSPIIICGEQVDGSGAQEGIEKEVEENEGNKRRDESAPNNRKENSMNQTNNGHQMTYQQPLHYISAKVPDYCYPPAPASASAPPTPFATLPRQDYGQAYYEHQLRLAQDEICWFRYQSGMGYQQYAYPSYEAQNPSAMGYMQWNWNHMG